MKLNAVEIMDKLIKERILIEERIRSLGNTVSFSDKALLDLDHITEFYDFSASQMCKINKLRKDILREKRLAKDESGELRPLLSMTSAFKKTNKTYQKVKDEMDLHIGDCKSRHYNVRVLTELLGTSLKKNERPYI